MTAGHAADARHGFALSRVLSQGRRIAQIDIRPENLGRRAPLDGRSSAMSARRSRPCCCGWRAGQTAPSGRSVANYARRVKGWTISPRASRAQTDPPAISHQPAQRAGSGRRRFHLRCGHRHIWAARYLKMNGRRRLIGSLARTAPWPTRCRRRSARRRPFSAGRSSACRAMAACHADGRMLTLTQAKLPVSSIVYNNGSAWLRRRWR